MSGNIYLIQNLINGKCYIGQTIGSVEKRFIAHKTASRKGSEVPLHRAMRKYGIENFTIILLAKVEEFFLNELEKFFIICFNSLARNGFGYNAAKGGNSNSGWVSPLETRLKISKARKGLIFSKETRERMSHARMGMKFSEQHRSNLSKSKHAYLKKRRDNAFLC